MLSKELKTTVLWFAFSVRVLLAKEMLMQLSTLLPHLLALSYFFGMFNNLALLFFFLSLTYISSQFV